MSGSSPRILPRNSLLWSPEDHLGKSVDDVFGIPITGTNTPNNPFVFSLMLRTEDRGPFSGGTIQEYSNARIDTIKRDRVRSCR